MPLVWLAEASLAVAESSMAVVGNATVLILPDWTLMLSPSETSKTGTALPSASGCGSHTSLGTMLAAQAK